jgi:hypothetical protein
MTYSYTFTSFFALSNGMFQYIRFRHQCPQPTLFLQRISE